MTCTSLYLVDVRYGEKVSLAESSANLSMEKQPCYDICRDFADNRAYAFSGFSQIVP
jgi:hypothetical protein